MHDESRPCNIVCIFNHTCARPLSLQVTLGGVNIAGSPFLVEVHPVQLSPDHTLVAGAGLSEAVSGRAASFAVTLRDAFGNETSAGARVEAFHAWLDGGGGRVPVTCVQGEPCVLALCTSASTMISVVQ